MITKEFLNKEFFKYKNNFNDISINLINYLLENQIIKLNEKNIQVCLYITQFIEKNLLKITEINSINYKSISLILFHNQKNSNFLDKIFSFLNKKKELILINYLSLYLTYNDIEELKIQDINIVNKLIDYFTLDEIDENLIKSIQFLLKKNINDKKINKQTILSIYNIFNNETINKDIQKKGMLEIIESL